MGDVTGEWWGGRIPLPVGSHSFNGLHNITITLQDTGSRDHDSLNRQRHDSIEDDDNGRENIS